MSTLNCNPRLMKALAKNLPQPLSRALAVAAAVMLVDQLSKVAVRHSIGPREIIHVLPGMQLVNAQNQGIGFGLLSGYHLVINASIVVALAALVIYFLRHRAKPLIWLPTGLLLGGAIGNLFDRIRAGGVTDFVQLPLGWPLFNLADVAITLGLVLLTLIIEVPNARRDRLEAKRG